MLDKAERLKIAFVTDIHQNHQQIQNLSQWTNTHYNTQQKFDYCFIGGDTTSCYHDKMNYNQQQMLATSIGIHKQLKNIFNCKLFFVPGNHDCKNYYDVNYQCQDVYNIHYRKIELSNGLELVGFGGSVPTYFEGKQYWAGYPYKNQKQLQIQLQKWDIFTDKSKITNQTIMLTHIGPILSQTTIDRSVYPSRILLTGSQYLNKLLQRKDILCWFHGHTHDGSNNAKINGIQIINPGPLTDNKFMYLELVKENGKWKIAKKCFQIL